EFATGVVKRAFGRKNIDAAIITSAPTSNPAPRRDHHLFFSWPEPSRVSLVPSISQKFSSSAKESLQTGHIFIVSPACVRWKVSVDEPIVAPRSNRYKHA